MTSRRIGPQMRTSRHRAVVSIAAVALISAACTSGGADESTTTTSLVASTTTTAAGPTGATLRVGLVGPITSDNWFAVLDGPANTEPNRAYLEGSKLSLFATSLPGFVHVPKLAATASPVEPILEGAVWVVEQPMREDVFWSDGTPVTANDLVFYFETVRTLDLGTDHAARFGPAVQSITAPDDHTVRIEFTQGPGLADWDAGVALAPFVPSHFWGPVAEEAVTASTEAMSEITPDRAVAAIVADSLADDNPANDIATESVSQQQIDQYVSRVGLLAGKAVLYGASGVGEPSLGPLIVDRRVEGEFAVSLPNAAYFDAGTENTLYSDGSFRIANAARGEDAVFGGAGAGDILAHYVEGPVVSEVRWIESETRQDAYTKLANGEVDYVFDSTGIAVGLRDQLGEIPGMEFWVSQAEGYRYMAFNLRKAPMSDVTFRRAVATLIDKELLADSVLEGAVFPAYTMIPSDLTAHHNADVPRAGWDGEPMPEDERLVAAVRMLDEAGYSWAREPSVNYDDGGFVDVTPGEGLTMPNGTRVPELSLLAPGPSDDPFRATFAVWIGDWLTDLGVPVTVEHTDFDNILAVAFPPQTPDSALGWDMYILGWGAPDVSLPGATLRAFFHSDQDSVLRGGFNTPGYSSEEFDDVADAFDSAATLSEAAELTKQMEAILAEDLPYVVLFRTPIIEAHVDRVHFPVESIMGGQSGYPNGWPNAVIVDE